MNPVATSKPALGGGSPGSLSYGDFIEQKTHLGTDDGFVPDKLPDYLYGFQRDLTEWALMKGRAAIFADCGLGKTPMQLVWADNVYRHTGKPVLIITPLAVTFQTEKEADKFGIEASVSRTGKVASPITITNYDRLHLFDETDYSGVVCDESSALKSFDGERRKLVTSFMRKMPYRLLCTATAAPNDYIELGTSSEALGELGYMDMLNRYFINKEKSSDTKGRYRGFASPRMWERKAWRFKGHAEEAFWRWVSSWARALRKPSDLGYDDDGFILPALNHEQHEVKAENPQTGRLFDLEVFGLREEREELRRTLTERCEKAAEILSDADPAIAWCYLNTESALLKKMIPGAVEVKGSDSIESKEESLLAFSRGDIRVLVTKPLIAGWGLNWQHCHRMTFFPSHSYEQYYQAVRRCWRFGQVSPVKVDVITTEGGRRALENLGRKAAQADQMFDSLTSYMDQAMTVRREDGFTNSVEVPEWA